LAYAIFIRDQKNYYKKLLLFIQRKKRFFHHYFKFHNLNGEVLTNYLLDDVRFFAEDFFVNFEGDGVLKYHQYKTIMGIYRHIMYRLKITRRDFQRAKNRDYEGILIHLQLFDKMQVLNDQYFDHQLPNNALLKENANVYTTLTFSYSRSKNTVELDTQKKPIFYSMGTDLDFKKNLYYIFSFQYEIETKIAGEDLEQSYFFIACSYRDEKHSRVHPSFFSRKEKVATKKII
jgi:hypothetical protein